jgi:hypothetical protein
LRWLLCYFYLDRRIISWENCCHWFSCRHPNNIIMLYDSWITFSLVFRPIHLELNIIVLHWTLPNLVWIEVNILNLNKRIKVCLYISLFNKKLVILILAAVDDIFIRNHSSSFEKEYYQLLVCANFNSLECFRIAKFVCDVCLLITWNFVNRSIFQIVLER